MIGWGHVLYGTLATMDESSPRSESADEFLYSCDALLAFRRLQFICSVYYHDHHPAPSRTLVQICHRVTLRLLELCKEFTASLLQPSPSSMTSFRYAKLLMALAPLAVRETGIFDDVFRVLRQCGVQLSDDQPDTIGWRWFLDQTQRQSPIACGPTALILTSLVSVESALQTAGLPVSSILVSLIDSAASCLCELIESGYQPRIEELVVCIPSIGSYCARPIITSELTRRRLGVIRSKHLVLSDGILASLASNIGLVTLRLSEKDELCSNDSKRSDHRPDESVDVHLNGPIVSAFLNSENPTHREFAFLAFRKSLRDLKYALDQDRPISTPWVASVLDSVPTTFDTALPPEESFKDYRRFVSVPCSRVQLLVISDTQFGHDSVAYRSPLARGNDSFEEVQPATFDQLISDAARSLEVGSADPFEWSGILHLGDVVCKAEFDGQETVATEALKHSAEILGVPASSIVVTPGNHDFVRSGIVEDLRTAMEQKENISKSELPSFEDLVLGSIRRNAFQSVLPHSGFTSFRDMYSRLLQRRISPSDGGIEVISFLAPRLTVHVISLWPVIRYGIRNGAHRRLKQNVQYGFDPKAQHDIRDFLLHFSEPGNAVILLSHIPPENSLSWSEKDSDFRDWIGAPAAVDMGGLLDYVVFPPNRELKQPSIHLILSGHLQTEPKARWFRDVLSYTVGAFHIRSGISAGSFAARVSIDEGAIRIDSTRLRRSKGDSEGNTYVSLPIVVTLGTSPVRMQDYRSLVLDSYNNESEQFISTTNVPGKYFHLERVRRSFSDLIVERFGNDYIHVLDIGAGAGRDSDFFLKEGFRVSAIEGAPRLAAALRSRHATFEELTVFELNVLERSALGEALKSNSFQGIWMCATLLHVPAEGDVSHIERASFMVDFELVKLVASFLAPGGLLYLDNKLGFGSHLKERGNVLKKRWFKYRQQEDLERLIALANLRQVDASWHNGTNGFDAWTWILAEAPVVN